MKNKMKPLKFQILRSYIVLRDYTNRLFSVLLCHHICLYTTIFCWKLPLQYLLILLMDQFRVKNCFKEVTFCIVGIPQILIFIRIIWRKDSANRKRIFVMVKPFLYQFLNWNIRILDTKLSIRIFWWTFRNE